MIDLTNFAQNVNSPLIFLSMSFLGGIIASISPCTLGILPVIIGYIGGYDKNKNVFLSFVQLVSFVLGLSVILTVIGIFCALTGRVFASFGGSYWILIMASFIMLFGLNLLGVIEIPIPVFIKKMPKSNSASLFIYPFILGFFFALASTPCSTPILASIMSFAALSDNILYAACALFLFALGQGMIIILAGIFTSFVKNLKCSVQCSTILMKMFGLMLIISSIILFYNIFSPFF